MKSCISIRGDRKLWLQFTLKLKKEGKKVWPVLEPYIKKELEV